MKRFFCTTCQRVRRVRRMPVNSVQNLNAVGIQWIGDCDIHADGQSRSSAIRNISPIGKPRANKSNKVVAVPIAVKRGKR